MAYKIQKGQVEGLREALLELAEDILQTGVDLTDSINSAILSLTAIVNSTGNYLDTKIDDIDNTLTANLALTGMSVQNQINLLPDQVDYDLLDSRIDSHDTEIDLISGRVNLLSGVVSGLKDFESDILAGTSASMPLTGSGEAIVANSFKHRVEVDFSISGGSNVYASAGDSIYISGKQGVDINAGDETYTSDINISANDDINITASGEILVTLPTGTVFIRNYSNDGGEIACYNWYGFSMDFTGDGSYSVNSEGINYTTDDNEYGNNGSIIFSPSNLSINTKSLISENSFSIGATPAYGLYFTSDSGDITMSALKGHFDIQVGNGGINIDSLGGDADFITHSGNMTIKCLQSNSPNKGDMTIYAGKAMDISSHSGDISVLADMYLDLDAESGIILRTNNGAGAYLQITNLPTTNPGGTNRVWRDGGILKIT